MDWIAVVLVVGEDMVADMDVVAEVVEDVVVDVDVDVSTIFSISSIVLFLPYRFFIATTIGVSVSDLRLFFRYWMNLIRHQAMALSLSMSRRTLLLLNRSTSAVLTWTNFVCPR